MGVKISFRLKDNNDPTLIYLHVNCGLSTINSITGKKKYYPIIISTGIRINQKDWDSEVNFPSKTFLRNNKRIELELRKFETASFDAINHIELNDELSFNKETIKSEILRRSKNKISKQRTSVKTRLSEFIEQYISQNKTINQNTLKGYKSFLRKVEEYDTYFNPIILENLDRDLIKSFFFDFLLESRTYTNNSLNKIKGRFSKFVNEARKKGVPVGCLVEDVELKFNRYTPKNVYLNFEEIQTLFDLDLSGEPYKERARDIFIILCLTGQRINNYKILSQSINDIRTIDDNNVQREYIRLVPPTINDKNKIVIVPLFNPVREILNRHNGFPKRIPDQKLNQIIKDVCEDAGIDRKVDFESLVNGDKTRKWKKSKYEMVSSHTGRRSFVTNFKQLGVNEESIMSVTGHSNKKRSGSFHSYDKTELEIKLLKFYSDLKFIEKRGIKLPMRLLSDYNPE